MPKALESPVMSTTLAPGSTVGIDGKVQVKGLSIAGKFTAVALDAINWAPLPAVAQTNRNAIRIQNQSNVEIKTQYDPLTVGYVGAIIAPNGSDAYDITEDIIIYAKCETGTCTILVEELS